MSQNTANDRIRQGGLQPDEVPEQSEGNRLIVRIASLAAANEQSGDTEQKQRQNWFCKMFLGCIKAILTVFEGKKMEPMTGFEPVTYSLRVNCSTS